MPIRDTARGRSFRDPRARRGTWRRRLAPCLPDAPCPHPATWGAPVSFEDTRVPEDDHLLGHFADLETVTYVFRPEGPVRTARVWNGVLPDCLEGDRVHPTALVRIGRVVDPDAWKESLREAAWTAARLVWLVVVRVPVFVLLSPFVSGSAAWDVCFVSGWLGDLI
ncbi:hypothetical protein HYQ46_006234 [Verticillium longisporum]|nr:hypothetical protein HYQ46_006234 [Verticillium longisporum]